MYEEKKIISLTFRLVFISFWKFQKCNFFVLQLSTWFSKIFLIFFFPPEKKRKPRGVDIISQGVTPQIFLIDVYLYKGIIFFIFKILSHKVHGVMYLKLSL